jgi:hypothetical protein
MSEHNHAYAPTAKQEEDYNAIPGPRCPRCGGRLWFDYETFHPTGLQFKCKKGDHNVWMLTPNLNEGP